MIRFLFLFDYKEPGTPEVVTRGDLLHTDLCYPAASALPNSLSSTQQSPLNQAVLSLS